MALFDPKKVKIRPSDYFLVSYPRSGNTWLRFMLTRLHPGVPDVAEERDIHKVIPNLDQDPDARTIPSPRVIKTHGMFDPDMKRVIYVVRDGRDSMLSYYQFSRHEFDYQGSFMEFLREPQFCLHWDRHVTSWLDRQQEIDLLLIRYEEMVENSRSQLQRVLDFLDWKPDPAAIDEAVAESLLGRMQAREQQGKFLARVGKGQPGAWRNDFGEPELAFFMQTAGPVLRRLGYPDC